MLASAGTFPRVRRPQHGMQIMPCAASIDGVPSVLPQLAFARKLEDEIRPKATDDDTDPTSSYEMSGVTFVSLSENAVRGCRNLPGSSAIEALALVGIHSFIRCIRGPWVTTAATLLLLKHDLCLT